MGVVQDRGTGLSAQVAGDLTGRAVLADSGDDQFVAVEAGPDPSVDQLVRDRVAHGLDRDRRVPADPAGGAERRRERTLGQRVQPVLFLGEPLGRLAPGHLVRAGVDLLAERPAGGFQLAKGLVLLAQIDVPGHEIGFRDADGRLAAALGFRVRRQTSTYGRAVVAGHLDDLRIADRDAGDMVGGDRLLVVREDIGRDPADPA